MTGRTIRSPLSWLGALLLLYLTVPVVAFFIRFGQSSQRGFNVPGLGGALWVSLVTSTITTGLVALFGVPLAYILARHEGRWRTLVGIAVQLPLALPPLMSGILLIYLVGPYTTLGRFFDGRLTDSMAGIVLAQTFVSAPFLIIAARSAFASQDPALDDVAATLGHRHLDRFFRVSLPDAGTAVLAGLLLTWLRAFGEYGATVLISYHPYTLPVFTEVQFSGSGLPPTEAPTALALLAAIAVVGLSRLRRPARAGGVARPRRRLSPRPAPSRPVWPSTWMQGLAPFGSGAPITPGATVWPSSGRRDRESPSRYEAWRGCSARRRAPSASEPMRCRPSPLRTGGWGMCRRDLVSFPTARYGGKCSSPSTPTTAWPPGGWTPCSSTAWKTACPMSCRGGSASESAWPGP